MDGATVDFVLLFALGLAVATQRDGKEWYNHKQRISQAGLKAVADLEIQKGGLSHWREARSQIFGLPRPLSVTLEVRTEATLGLIKCLEISKELIRECVTMSGCCCCMPLLHNHLMDS